MRSASAWGGSASDTDTRCWELADGCVATGAHTVEAGLSARPVVDAFRRREIALEERIRTIDDLCSSDRWRQPVIGPAILR